MSNTIRSTGNCFDDALEFFEMFRLDNAAVRADVLRTMRVAHGICTTDAGETFAHAWVEERVRNDPDRRTWPERVVWQGMSAESGRAFFAVALDWFYEAYAVRERTLYTLTECAQLNRRHGTYGPWIARYRLLTGRKLAVRSCIPNPPLLGVVEPQQTVTNSPTT
jgi:hypothetical protein